MMEPEVSPWFSVQASSVTCCAHTGDCSGNMGSTSTHESPTVNPEAPSHRQSVSSAIDYSVPDDSVLEAVRAVERLSCYSEQESFLFESIMSEIVTLSVTTVCHIPRSVRPLFAQVLAKELGHATLDGLWGFARLFMLPKAVLRCPPRGGKKKRHVVKAELLSRLQRWQAGEIASLWEDARSDAKHHDKKCKHSCTAGINTRRSLRLAREGRFSNAMKALGSLGCASPDDTSALTELRQRHPEHSLPAWNEDIPPPLTVSSASVLAALRAFPPATSLGGSKLRCQHLLDAIDGTTTPSARDCLDRLTHFACFLLSGRADTRLAPWLTGAPLTALYKKQGGIRPIAVGEVVRRLISRLCCMAVRSRLPDVFIPTGQVGVGIRGGLEAAIHSLCSFIESNGSNADLCCLKIDFSNAFNECSRSTFLHRVHAEYPEIFAWSQWSYHCHGELLFGNASIRSTGGVQQGDPLGPLLFSLVILELLDDVDPIPDIRLQLWYLDDGTFVGKRSSVASFLDLLSSKGPAHGLYINMKKCEVFWPSGDNSFPEFPPKVQRIEQITGGAEFLGSPILGSNTFFDMSFAKRVDKVISCQEHLSDLEDPQVELHLLRSCLSLCKINHLLRTVPPERVQTQLNRFDQGLKHCLETIFNSSLPDQCWRQATLPVRFGGLGLREAARTSAAAFVGSCNSTRDLSCRLLGHTPISSVSTMDDNADSTSSTGYQQLVVPGELSTREILMAEIPDNNDIDIMRSTQHQFQVVLDSSLLRQLKDEANLRDRARLNSVSSTHCGAWIRAIPNPNLGLTMSPQEFTVALRLWLGIHVFPAPPTSIRCLCGIVMDPHGDHVLGCRYGSLRNKRHNALCDIIFHTALIDNRDCKMEQRCNSYNSNRPGDIYHPDFLKGRAAYFDVTVRNSLQPSYINKSATQAGAAAAAGELEKIAHYEEEVESSGCDFYPLVGETLGVWTPSSLEILKIMARRTVLTTGTTISKATHYLHQQLSVRLWQSNAKLALDRLAVSTIDSDIWDFV